MKSIALYKQQGEKVNINQSSISIILVRPQNHENIGLSARCMKNTGFSRLSLVGVDHLREKSYITAVHAGDILDSVNLYSDLSQAIGDLDVIFAATAKKRKNFSSVPLDEAVDKILNFSPKTRIGLLFGNERTGLTSDELRYSNFRFHIPQYFNQPSYNLASAVLITLFTIYQEIPARKDRFEQDRPLPFKEQEESICMILDKLEQRQFIHNTNKEHVTDMIFDLFGRLAITEKDRDLLLAIFSKGIGPFQDS